MSEINQPNLNIGDVVYEVFIYKIRKAKISGVRRLRHDHFKQSTPEYIYDIVCDDGSLSPAYYESDVGKYLFTDFGAAKARLKYNLKLKAECQTRENFVRQNQPHRNPHKYKKRNRGDYNGD